MFGADPGVPIHRDQPEEPDVPRAPGPPSAKGVEEVLDARVYIGFHFRTADEVGARVGRQVAHFVVNHTLRD